MQLLSLIRILILFFKFCQLSVYYFALHSGYSTWTCVYSNQARGYKTVYVCKMFQCRFQLMAINAGKKFYVLIHFELAPRRYPRLLRVPSENCSASASYFCEVINQWSPHTPSTTTHKPQQAHKCKIPYKLYICSFFSFLYVVSYGELYN
jgi:hypothetical protein